MKPTFLCPVCKDIDSPVIEGANQFPFCSESCRDRDLGGWLRNQYRIGSRAADSDELPELQEPLQD